MRDILTLKRRENARKIVNMTKHESCNLYPFFEVMLDHTELKKSSAFVQLIWNERNRILQTQ